MTDTTHTPAPDLPPPVTSIGVIGWLRANLFSSPLNAILTLLALYILYLAIPPVLDWAVFNATFEGQSRMDCNKTAACWVFIRVRFPQFMYGLYPIDERWRVNLAGILLLAAGIPLLFDSFPWKKWFSIFLLCVYPFIAFVLFYGGMFGLPVVETRLWGGLFLTLVIAITSIVASMPIGVLLALGRRSEMPVVRMLCIGFIEFVRAVPLITILFMSSVMLPLFLPEGVNFDKLARALIAIALFSAAYMAETVRGGLQAIPKGQYEAADSLGLTYWQTMRLIILPQALKIVIPGIVGSFIGLFKDTTLVLIIGLFDLLNIIATSAQDPNWIGMAIEGYAFAAVIFWFFCFAMSRYSMHIERKLHTGH